MSEQNELKKPHIADAAATQGESPLKQRVHTAAKREKEHTLFYRGGRHPMPCGQIEAHQNTWSTH
jgi:rubrerythrin